MRTAADARLDALDQRIIRARAAVIEARRAWAHSPNTDTIRAEQDAQEALDLLLEIRFKLQPRRASWRS